MIWHKAAMDRAAHFFAGLLMGLVAWVSPVSAQTFDSYRCADGTHFILAFYPHDSRAYLQIDGRPVTLKKGLTVTGRQYSGGGVRLMMTATGASIRHVRRPVTACEIS